MTADDPRYEVKNEQIQDVLQRTGKVVGDALPPGWGFALFLMSYGPTGSLFYMSSAERDGVIAAVAAWVERERGRPLQAPTPATDILDAWNRYAANMPADAPAVQFLECRRAFYAGAWSMLTTLTTKVGADDISEDDGAEAIATLQREVMAFAADVERGLK